MRLDGMGADMRNLNYSEDDSLEYYAEETTSFFKGLYHGAIVFIILHILEKISR